MNEGHSLFPRRSLKLFHGSPAPLQLHKLFASASDNPSKAIESEWSHQPICTARKTPFFQNMYHVVGSKAKFHATRKYLDPKLYGTDLEPSWIWSCNNTQGASYIGKLAILTPRVFQLNCIVFYWVSCSVLKPQVCLLCSNACQAFRNRYSWAFLLF